MQKQFLLPLSILFIFSGCAPVVSSPEHDVTLPCDKESIQKPMPCPKTTKTVVYKSSRCSHNNFPVSVRHTSDCQGDK